MTDEIISIEDKKAIKRAYYRERRKRLYWSDSDFRERSKKYDAKCRAKILNDPIKKEIYKQKCTNRAARYRKENPEKLKLRDKEKYEKNKYKIRHKTSEWLSVPTNRIRHLVTVRANYANKNNIKVDKEFLFSLTKEAFEECPICFCRLCYSSYVGKRRSRKEHYNSPSLDRVIPIKGYTKGNVRIICHRCNMIKNFGNAEEHRKIADYIENHVNKR